MLAEGEEKSQANQDKEEENMPVSKRPPVKAVEVEKHLQMVLPLVNCHSQDRILGMIELVTEHDDQGFQPDLQLSIQAMADVLTSVLTKEHYDGINQKLVLKKPQIQNFYSRVASAPVK
jgi:hypothetical protein